MASLFVALGGAAGALARYGLSGWVQGHSGSLFPVGTLVVNVVGSLLIGFVLQLSTDRFLMAPEWRLFLTTGFCGALTTFSTFSQETLALLQQQQWGAAAANAVLNVGLCLGAAFAGVVVARLL